MAIAVLTQLIAQSFILRIDEFLMLAEPLAQTFIPTP
jgi:hypothetical protein